MDCPHYLTDVEKRKKGKHLTDIDLGIIQALFWSSFFVTVMAEKISGLLPEFYRRRHILKLPTSKTGLFLENSML